MLELDHLAVAARSLDEGRALVEAKLGVTMQPGGKHDRFGTHNLLLGLEDGLYLEVITTDPAAPAPPRPRWFGLDDFEGPPRLNTWICRSFTLDAALAALPQAGAPVALTRGDLRWRMAVPDAGALPFDGRFPALMQWQGPGHPADRLDASGCRLLGLSVKHPQAPALQQALAGWLDDPRITFEVGPPALEAVFDTARGRRVLG